MNPDRASENRGDSGFIPRVLGPGGILTSLKKALETLGGPAAIPGAKKPAYLVLELWKSEPRVHQELRLEPQCFPKCLPGSSHHPVGSSTSLCPSNGAAPGTPEGGK